MILTLYMGVFCVPLLLNLQILSISSMATLYLCEDDHFFPLW